MKRLLIFTAILFITACTEEKSDYVKQLENSVNNSKNVEDSINSRYDRVTELVAAGMDQKKAESFVDSVDIAEAKLKSSIK